MTKKTVESAFLPCPNHSIVQTNFVSEALTAESTKESSGFLKSSLQDDKRGLFTQNFKNFQVLP